MMFAKRLREGVREGRITCSVRIWTRPHVRVGGVHPMEGGHIVVESIRPIAMGDITGELARRSGLDGVVDLLKVPRHGRGRHIYLIVALCAAVRVRSRARFREMRIQLSLGTPWRQVPAGHGYGKD